MSIPSFSTFPSLDSALDSGPHKPSGIHNAKNEDDGSDNLERAEKRKREKKKNYQRDRHESDDYDYNEGRRPSKKLKSEKSTLDVYDYSLDDHKSTLYISDRRGDSLNTLYGSLHTADIPKYHRKNRNELLGLRQLWNIVRRGNIEITDFKFFAAHPRGKLTKGLLDDRLASSPLTVLEDLERVELLLSFPKKMSVIDFFPCLCMKSSSDSDTELRGFQDEERVEEHDASAIVQQEVSPESKPNFNPTSITDWLALLSHLLSSNTVGATINNRARSDIIVSVLTKAFAADPTYRHSTRLLLLYLHAGEDIWEKDQLNTVWDSVLKDVGGPNIWMAWFEWRIRGANTSLDGVMDDFVRTKQNIAEGLSGEAADAARLRVLWRIALFFKQAGYIERAHAIFQAQVELTFKAPVHVTLLPFEEKLIHLEEFWDSDVPRTGEPLAPGWRSWVKSTVVATRPVMMQNRDKPADLVDDPYARWALSESLADRNIQILSFDAADENMDPYSTVIFSDIKSFLFPIATGYGERLLRYIWLSVLGLNTPGLTSSLSATSIDSAWACNYYAEGQFISSLLPFQSSLRLQSSDSYAGIQIGKQKQYRNSFSIIKEWGFNTLGPLEGIDLSGNARMWEDFQGDISIVRCIFEQLRVHDEDIEWKILNLAFEAIFDIKGALRLSRSFLSTSQTAIGLWASHAKLELIRGKEGEARRIYETIVSSDIYITNQNSALYQIWWDYAELEWLSGSNANTLKILLRASEQPADGTTSIRILRSKQRLEEVAEKFRYTWKDRCRLIQLRILLEFVTGTLQSVENVANKYLIEEIELKEHLEVLSMTFLLLLYHHSITLRNPISPNVLRGWVDKFSESYPDNTIIMGLKLECRKKEGIWDKFRELSSENHDISLNPKSTPKQVTEVYLASWDILRWPIEIERIRQVLDTAVSSEGMRGSYVIWKIYIELELRSGKLRKAKDLLFRAIKDCSFVKDLYMIAFGPLRSVFKVNELNGLADIMAERGIRTRHLLEDEVREWNACHKSVMEELEDEGDSELETNAQELRRLMPY